MFKFAFIENVPETTPDTYSCLYENEESYNLVAGTQSFDMTEALVKKLDGEGIEIINLCGDFTEEDVRNLSKGVRETMKIARAGYFPEELAKLNQLESLKEYGMVIVTKGVGETVPYEIKAEACNTYVRFSKDLDAAKQAATELVQQGVDFIELCGYFDAEKTREIIKAIDGRVPVGSCGV